MNKNTICMYTTMELYSAHIAGEKIRMNHDSEIKASRFQMVLHNRKITVTGANLGKIQSYLFESAKAGGEE